MEEIHFIQGLRSPRLTFGAAATSTLDSFLFLQALSAALYPRHLSAANVNCFTSGTFEIVPFFQTHGANSALTRCGWPCPTPRVCVRVSEFFLRAGKHGPFAALPSGVARNFFRGTGIFFRSSTTKHQSVWATSDLNQNSNERRTQRGVMGESPPSRFFLSVRYMNYVSDQKRIHLQSRSNQ